MLILSEQKIKIRSNDNFTDLLLHKSLIFLFNSPIKSIF